MANEQSKEKILYTSSNGGVVIRAYDVIPREEEQNLAAAKIIADIWGCRIILLGRVTERGIKTADAIIYWKGTQHGELWEIKTNLSDTERAIDKALRKAYKQASHVALHIKSAISDEALKSGIQRRVGRTNILEIILIRGNSAKRFTREEILSWS